MRKPIIAGNWKMNNTIAEAMQLMKGLIPLVKGVRDRDVVVCPPATALAVVGSALHGKNVILGAQNVHWAESGAYTGEISPKMLKELGVRYVIVGHSERRQYFGETDAGVNQRAKAALKAGLVPIICVGEALPTREKGTYKRFVARQVKLALAGFTSAEAAKIVIAYEPIWAIGTGETATADDAQEVCNAIREALRTDYGDATADATRILYGGSAKPGNIKELMAQPDVDGALVGGASLKADSFAAMSNFYA